jgi:hypothetical protein
MTKPMRAQGIYSPEVTEIANKIRRVGKRMTMDAIEIGNLLRKAKLVLIHGEWGPWLRTEFDWTQRQANRFLRLAELADEVGLDNLSNLDLSAAYLVASDATSEEARHEILERAEVDHVSHKVAQAIVAEHKPEQRGPKKPPQAKSTVREALRVIARAAEQSSPEIEAPALADASELIQTVTEFLREVRVIVGDPRKLAEAQFAAVPAPPKPMN